MTFTPEELQAIVDTAEFSDPEAAAYLHDVIVKRQRKTAAYYLTRINPLDRFEVTADGLAFVNVAEAHDFVSPGTTYRAAWSVYDNTTGSTTSLGEVRTLSTPLLPLPSARPTGAAADRFLMAEVRSLNETHPTWNEPIRIYLRPAGAGFEVVGIDRDS